MSSRAIQFCSGGYSSRVYLKVSESHAKHQRHISNRPEPWQPGPNPFVRHPVLRNLCGHAFTKHYLFICFIEIGGNRETPEERQREGGQRCASLAYTI
jgi:hypothetical protein